MIAIGAIFKNECSYVTEWISYHKSIGFNKFYIVDNISDDGTSELLVKLHEKGEIVRIEYQTVVGIKPQVPAYNLIIERAKKECEYIAFIDADEFFNLENPHGKIQLLVDKFNVSDDVGAIAINWSLYGSSGCILPGSGLVIERFDHRAEKNCHLNLHYKSFLKISAFESTKGGGVHHFKLKDGYKYIMTDGSDLNGSTGLSEYVSWECCRLNHYVIKSNGEFYTKKMARGRAAGDNGTLNKYFFNNHDKNEVRDSFPYEFLSRVKYYKNKLESLVDYSPSPENKIQLYKCGDFIGRSYVDHVSKDNDLLKFQGWATYTGEDEVEGIVIVINKSDIIFTNTFLKRERPDVVSCGISDYSMCGFHATFDMSLFVCQNVRFLDFYAVNGFGNALFEINIDSKLNYFHKTFPQLNINKKDANNLVAM